ncbi:hypothetical protein HBH98_132920 [Parastagonospora nodorum]|nr:hypothetical protein HBH53_110210 [Parastagonospora nodorum]KAH3997663.1 hypothetical protein HBI10_136070 [Parastagonospora nodorum]KAH4020553.1 hypothetical protein HBI13_116400 [Parastagonospora nodorum]KAH4119307.1 hypothetical protein HBH47_129170 [Parastagonospora nodorum]KAH4344479.1 hypothetical protein HBH98_132920 [Parastagonospora nodorum]
MELYAGPHCRNRKTMLLCISPDCRTSETLFTSFVVDNLQYVLLATLNCCNLCASLSHLPARDEASRGTKVN